MQRLASGQFAHSYTALYRRARTIARVMTMTAPRTKILEPADEKQGNQISLALLFEKACSPAPVCQAIIGLESCHHLIHGRSVPKPIYLGLLVGQQSHYMRTLCHNSYSCTVRTSLVSRPLERSENEGAFVQSAFSYTDGLSLC